MSAASSELVACSSICLNICSAPSRSACAVATELAALTAASFFAFVSCLSAASRASFSSAATCASASASRALSCPATSSASRIALEYCASAAAMMLFSFCDASATACRSLSCAAACPASAFAFCASAEARESDACFHAECHSLFKYAVSSSSANGLKSELKRTLSAASRFEVMSWRSAANARRALEASSLFSYVVPLDSFHALNARTICEAENFSACPAFSAASRAMLISSGVASISEEDAPNVACVPFCPASLISFALTYSGYVSASRTGDRAGAARRGACGSAHAGWSAGRGRRRESMAEGGGRA
mmetsp:Transcript_30115/g.63273  ORF Transcript_30115/g.63273 Transcript_30115/m.63273 type:complete len:307 (+) Transcript_30115:727-1647(+)